VNRYELDAFAFDPDKHEYSLNGRIIPSCSGVISSALQFLSPYIAEDVLEKRSELGREVHKACHLHNISKFGGCDDRVRPYLDAWIRFKEQTGYKPILSEFQQIGHLNAMTFGMQIDNFGFLKKDETLAELKIGKVYPHHGVQLAGYAAGLAHDRLATALARFMVRKRMVVQLGADGFPKVTVFGQRSDFDVFASLLHASTWKMQFNSVYRENAI